MTIKKAIALLYSKKYIYATNSLTTSTFFGIGDSLSQFIICEDKANFKWNKWRTVRLFLVGGCIGIMSTKWYNLLDSNVKFDCKMKETFSKICCDFSTTPFFSSFAITTNGLLEGKSFKKSFTEYSNQWSDVLKADAKIWPPAQIINFFLLPHKFRVLYVAFVDIIYSCAISYFAHIKAIPTR
uniref:Mpv17-like protein n=1 Tax=Rhabditophanes sp. KR3021 TaxID=114890 RepID=A0AC35U2D0_9BILA